MTRHKELLQIVIAVVADTFDVPPDTLGAETTADDVDGWDSLAHTILMVRLQRRLGLIIPERVAAEACSLGELARGLQGVEDSVGAPA